MSNESNDLIFLFEQGQVIIPDIFSPDNKNMLLPDKTFVVWGRHGVVLPLWLQKTTNIHLITVLLILCLYAFLSIYINIAIICL